MTPALSLRDVTVTYDRHPAVHHVAGDFAQGSLTALIGPNGAGKSTLVKLIAGLLSPSEGTVLRHGPGDGGIGYLPQMSAIDDSFPITVHDVVALGLWRRIGAFAPVTGGMLGRIAAALEAVGLAGFEDRLFGALSAGQRQRVLFARVMASDSRLILLDEPFSAMDERTIADLLHLIERWHDEGRTQIVVLHDIELVRRFFPDCLLMARGLVAWGATDTVLTPENLARARSMSEAWFPDADICQGAA